MRKAKHTWQWFIIKSSCDFIIGIICFYNDSSYVHYSLWSLAGLSLWLNHYYISTFSCDGEKIAPRASHRTSRLSASEIPDLPHLEQLFQYF